MNANLRSLISLSSATWCRQAFPAPLHTHHLMPTPHPLPQLHHLLNNGAEVNQRDEKGFTPLHRAAYLAHFDGYLEIYEYLLVRPVMRETHSLKVAVLPLCSTAQLSFMLAAL